MTAIKRVSAAKAAKDKAATAGILSYEMMQVRDHILNTTGLLASIILSAKCRRCGHVDVVLAVEPMVGNTTTVGSFKAMSDPRLDGLCDECHAQFQDFLAEGKAT